MCPCPPLLPHNISPIQADTGVFDESLYDRGAARRSCHVKRGAAILEREKETRRAGLRDPSLMTCVRPSHTHRLHPVPPYTPQRPSRYPYIVLHPWTDTGVPEDGVHNSGVATSCRQVKRGAAALPSETCNEGDTRNEGSTHRTLDIHMRASSQEDADDLCVAKASSHTERSVIVLLLITQV